MTLGPTHSETAYRIAWRSLAAMANDGLEPRHSRTTPLAVTLTLSQATCATAQMAFTQHKRARGQRFSTRSAAAAAGGGAALLLPLLLLLFAPTSTTAAPAGGTVMTWPGQEPPLNGSLRIVPHAGRTTAYPGMGRLEIWVSPPAGLNATDPTAAFATVCNRRFKGPEATVACRRALGPRSRWRDGCDKQRRVSPDSSSGPSGLWGVGKRPASAVLSGKVHAHVFASTVTLVCGPANIHWHPARRNPRRQLGFPGGVAIDHGDDLEDAPSPWM